MSESTDNTQPTGWPYFSREELACRHCGELSMNREFMDRLVNLRRAYARPMSITSGCRCRAHDAAIGGADVHPTGRGVDVAIAGNDVHRLIRMATAMGFTGIGINQRGDWARRFVHLDDLPECEFNDHGMCVSGHRHHRPRVWTY